MTRVYVKGGSMATCGHGGPNAGRGLCDKCRVKDWYSRLDAERLQEIKEKQIARYYAKKGITDWRAHYKPRNKFQSITGDSIVMLENDLEKLARGWKKGREGG